MLASKYKLKQYFIIEDECRNVNVCFEVLKKCVLWLLVML